MEEKASNPFHDHLDVCRRCRDQPFNLCPHGEAILREYVVGEAPGPLGWKTGDGFVRKEKP